MTKLITVLAIFFGAMAVSACSVEGVSDYQRAMNMGCTPTAQGGLVCGSERG
jgi:hypothetical protein